MHELVRYIDYDHVILGNADHARLSKAPPNGCSLITPSHSAETAVPFGLAHPTWFLAWRCVVGFLFTPYAAPTHSLGTVAEEEEEEEEAERKRRSRRRGKVAGSSGGWMRWG